MSENLRLHLLFNLHHAPKPLSPWELLILQDGTLGEFYDAFDALRKQNYVEQKEGKVLLTAEGKEFLISQVGDKKQFDAKGLPQVVKIRLTPARAKKLELSSRRRKAHALNAAEDAPVNFSQDALRNKRRKTSPTTIKLRKSITPGTVLILLKGRHQGKKAIFLKQWQSGLLLVNGPSNVNGVALSRVKQQYVIATSTKVDIAGVNVDSVTDDLWPKKKEAGKRSAPKTEEEYFAPEKGKKEEKAKDPKRVEAQKAINKSLAAAVGKVPMLNRYLRNRFTLSRGVYAHNIKF